MEEGMATHSSILAWKIPWTEEPGGLQSMESQRVRHGRDCTTKTGIILIDCVALTGYGEKGRGWAEGCGSALFRSQAGVRLQHRVSGCSPILLVNEGLG